MSFIGGWGPVLGGDHMVSSGVVVHQNNTEEESLKIEVSYTGMFMLL